MLDRKKQLSLAHLRAPIESERAPFEPRFLVLERRKPHLLAQLEPLLHAIVNHPVRREIDVLRQQFKFFIISSPSVGLAMSGRPEIVRVKTRLLLL